MAAFGESGRGFGEREWYGTIKCYADGRHEQRWCTPLSPAATFIWMPFPPPPWRRIGSITKTCFRKALVSLNWRTVETHGRPAQPPSRACIDTAGAPRRATYSASKSPLSTSEKTRPSAATLLELGRFELLQSRSVRRASALFKACLDESPWHAAAGVGGGGGLGGAVKLRPLPCSRVTQCVLGRWCEPRYLVAGAAPPLTSGSRSVMPIRKKTSRSPHSVCSACAKIWMARDKRLVTKLTRSNLAVTGNRPCLRV